MLMNVEAENLLYQFLRCQYDVFTVEDVLEGFLTVGLNESAEDIASFLLMCPSVFALDGGGYLSKAGVFTDALFSIKPTKMEIQKGILIPGHRCVPFVDSDCPSGNIDFIFDGKVLPHKIITLPLQEALPYFSLYGEEYAVQYIMADPANSSDEINFCDLPSQVKLTVTDFSKIYKDFNFAPGDTFLASVIDWSRSFVGIQPMISEKNTPFEQNPLDSKREQWYLNLENALCKSFELFGPGVSIDDQISKAFFLGFDKLCVKSCGTVEQFIRQTKKIGFEPYGVESRLWLKGLEVPAVGSWIDYGNNSGNDIYGTVKESQNTYPILTSVLDSWIMDELYSKKENDEKLIENLFPENYILTESERIDIKEKIYSRKNYLKSRYNWFADFEAGDIRHRVLLLYRKIITLVYDIDSLNSDLNTMPQQSLVILMQLMNHSRFMLEAFLNVEEIDSSEIVNYGASLDGMEYNFDEVAVELRAALSKQIKTKFSMFKK